MNYFQSANLWGYNSAGTSFEICICALKALHHVEKFPLSSFKPTYTNPVHLLRITYQPLVGPG